MSKSAPINLEEKNAIVVRQYKRNDKLIYKRVMCWDFSSQGYIPQKQLIENTSCYDLVYENLVSQAEFFKILKKWSKKSYRCSLPTSLNNALKEKLGSEYILTADRLGNEWSEQHTVLTHTIGHKKYRTYSPYISGTKRKWRKRARPLDYGEVLKGSKNMPQRYGPQYDKME